MFDESVAPLLESATPTHVEELVIYAEESRFFRLFEQAESDHGVTIGSYPQRGHIVVRATGPAAAAKAAIAAIREAVAPYLQPR